MPIMQTRRRFLTTLSLAVVGGLIGPSRASGAEGAFETTTLRLTRTPALCVAPLYVAEELLRAEGFTDIRHVPTASATESANAIGAGQADPQFRLCVRVYHWDRFRPGDNGPGWRDGGLLRIVSPRKASTPLPTLSARGSGCDPWARRRMSSCRSWPPKLVWIPPRILIGWSTQNPLQSSSSSAEGSMCSLATRLNPSTCALVISAT